MIDNDCLICQAYKIKLDTMKSCIPIPPGIELRLLNYLFLIVYIVSCIIYVSAGGLKIYDTQNWSCNTTRVWITTSYHNTTSGQSLSYSLYLHRRLEWHYMIPGEHKILFNGSREIEKVICHTYSRNDDDCTLQQQLKMLEHMHKYKHGWYRVENQWIDKTTGEWYPDGLCLLNLFLSLILFMLFVSCFIPVVIVEFLLIYCHCQSQHIMATYTYHQRDHLPWTQFNVFLHGLYKPTKDSSLHQLISHPLYDHHIVYNMIYAYICTPPNRPNNRDHHILDVHLTPPRKYNSYGSFN